VDLDHRTILITGGTGSFGRRFTGRLLAMERPPKVVVLSRDEYKQSEMAKLFPDTRHDIRYFLGDVRDRERLYRAFEGVDYVIHSAALKQVPALEYNPFEAVKTNIIGAENIVDAAIDRGVRKVIALSTDKAVAPVNLYGATKLAMEKIFIAANAYAGTRDSCFSIVRYGNVAGSRGSVIPHFLELLAGGAEALPVTDARMTRFWLGLEGAVDLVLHALEHAEGGEVFVPKIPSLRITDVVEAIRPGCPTEIVGIRPGEKLHETLISDDEARSTVDAGRYYRILPSMDFQAPLSATVGTDFPPVPEDFVYRSDLNEQWLSVEALHEMIGSLDAD
jgi:UDP-N-acetylglucosamine 4,6-dehydratase